MTVPYHTLNRQWDIRLNVQEEEYLNTLVTNIKKEYDKGKFQYILIGGVEIGTKPTHSDYQIKHIHVAAIFGNRVSKKSILQNWGIREGNGYYMVPRNRQLPYKGWREHHIKEATKIDKSKLILYECGNLPSDAGEKETRLKSSEEKKRPLDEVLREMRGLLEEGQDEDAFTKYPRNYLMYGAKIKALIHQQKKFKNDPRDPHIWLFGFPGTGKTQILNYVYDKSYKKDLSNRFFDLFKPDIHSHILLEDLDPMNVEKLGIQFLKTICDEAGFPIGTSLYYMRYHHTQIAKLSTDQKYQTPQPIRATCLVTSNFAIDEVIPDNTKGIEKTKAALLRRFWHVRIDNFLRILGLKLIDKWERNKLKSEGNEDPTRIFLTWDYATDSPLGTPVEKPEIYREKILQHFYKQ